MSTLSPVSTVCQYELWLLTGSGFAQPLPDCGLYGSCREAAQVASVVRTWLHLGVWGDVLNWLDPEAQDELCFLRRGMAALGVELTSVHVAVRKYATDHDNRDSTLAADWLTGESMEDTREFAVDFAYIASDDESK